MAAQRKYLYLDSAYGFWPQLSLATCFASLSISLLALTALRKLRIR